MNNPVLGSILGSVLGSAMRRRGYGGGLGGGLGGAALGSVLGGMLGRGRGGMAAGRGGMNRGALVAMLLPMAMRWVQRNGGIGEVLKRFQQRGYRKQAQSWVDLGDNQPVDVRAIDDVVGAQELQQLSQQLGVPQHDVAEALAEIFPEMVNQLSPEGLVPDEADDVLDEGRREIERELEQASRMTQAFPS